MPTDRQKRTLPERINHPSRSAFTGQRFNRSTIQLSFPRRHTFLLFFLTLSLSSLFPLPLHAASLPDYAARARKTYQEARDKHSESPKDVQLAWRFGCACFDVADFSTNNAERGDFAEQGIAACNNAIASDPRCAPAHYYLGMNLGQLAQTRGLSALKLVDQMEAEFKDARQLDEKFDFGGPDRNLGLLYRDAPSWISVGSRGRATKHLLRAAELAPDYPENPLNLLESYEKWSDRNGIKRQLKIVEDIWPRARKQFSGTQWELSWTNWTDRLQQVRKKINEPSRTIESPRAKD